MTPQEFKAWFDGFTEAVDKQPTQKQWARIKERVAEIDGKPVTERVYVDRYLPSYPIYAQPVYKPWYGTVWCSNSLNAAQVAAQQGYNGGSGNAATISFNSLTAMNDLGKADAASLS